MQDSRAPPQAWGGKYNQTKANQDKSPGWERHRDGGEGKEGGRAGKMRQRKSQNKTEAAAVAAAAKETHFTAKKGSLSGLVTPHNAYCHHCWVVLTSDKVNVCSLWLRQKTLCCVRRSKPERRTETGQSLQEQKQEETLRGQKEGDRKRRSLSWQFSCASVNTDSFCESWALKKSLISWFNSTNCSKCNCIQGCRKLLASLHSDAWPQFSSRGQQTQQWENTVMENFFLSTPNITSTVLSWRWSAHSKW